MQQDTVGAVFAELKKIGQCNSRSDFNRDWLGREQSYFRSVQLKRRVPSTDAQVNLIARLRDLGMDFTRSGHPTLDEIGKTYLRLYGECLDALLTGARAPTRSPAQRRALNEVLAIEAPEQCR
jgi:hypothetical protein